MPPALHPDVTRDSPKNGRNVDKRSSGAFDRHPLQKNCPRFTDRLPTCGCAYDSVSGVRIPPVEVRWRRPLGLSAALARGLSRMLAVVYLEWP
jgi:hypothetical protein